MTSSRIFSRCSTTLVIGGMFVQSTTESCSTQARSALNSTSISATWASSIATRASLAMRRTVSLSTDMINYALAILMLTLASNRAPSWQAHQVSMIKVDISELKADLRPGQRLMGLDLGEKTIGLALS